MGDASAHADGQSGSQLHEKDTVGRARTEGVAMKMELRTLARARLLLALVAAALAAVALAARSSAAEENVYTVHNIISNVAGAADQQDPHLLNGWGLDSIGGSPWWVANNHDDSSRLYTAAGGINPLVVTVDGAPTGLVGNVGGANSFRVTKGATTARAAFLFASEDGKIRGWNPGVDPTVAQVGFSSPDGASYKGLAIAALQSGDRLYATDFKNAKVDMFDANFGLVSDDTTFVDPTLPDGYAPFGIRVLAGKVFVAYAKRDEEGEDEVAGQSLGFVDAFTTAGAFERRVATRGQLNAPWGLAIAPTEGFGRFGGDLLVGNFGDGQINAYEELGNGHFEYRGTLRGDDGKPLTIDGLWAIEFGRMGNNGSPDTLFFTAGPNDENDGLFGSIKAG
jgi:uncharacterized protein (TIGR03118 family)